MSKLTNYIIPTRIHYKLLVLSLVTTILLSCSEKKTDQTNHPMVGTWNIRLEEIPDEYTHAITLTNTSWTIVENGMQNRGPWSLSGDTLILKRFTRIHEYVNGQLQIGEKPMKYIITNKEKNHFEAIPYFEKDVDSFITFVFERE